MAIYSLNLGFISRSAGRSSVGFSAYISGSKVQDERTGTAFNFSHKQDILGGRVLAPSDAPSWALDPSQLWNAVEAFEDHIAELRFRGGENSQAAKEKFINSAQTAQTIMGALPLELTRDQAEACVEDFLKQRFVSRGLVVQYAIHWEKHNPHFHGLVTRRPLQEGRFANRKDREIVSKSEHNQTRALWAEVANKHLALAGHDVRIDHRSNADRGLLFEATRHEGWHAQRLAETGQYSRIVAANDAIRQKNIEILASKPEALIQELAQKRTTFTRRHIEDEIVRRVGGDEKLFALLHARVQGVITDPDLIRKRVNDNREEGISDLSDLAARFAGRLLADSAITYRVGENIDGAAVYTSKSYQVQEETITDYGDQLAARTEKHVSDALIEQAIHDREGELNTSLAPEQRTAIHHLCSGPDIRVLNGKAGTGKTTLLKAVASAYARSGYTVLGTSFQGKAVDIMASEIGIPCRTLDSFLHHWKQEDQQRALIDSGKLWGEPYLYAFDKVRKLAKHRFTSKDVIIVDEANMIGISLWEPFLKEASSRGAKVLIVQDPAQIKSRDPGDVGRLLSDLYGYAETRAVIRQRVDWQRAASEQLNDHQILDGLRPYQDSNHIHWLASDEEACQRLAQDYVTESGISQMALAYTNEEVTRLNALIRQGLMDKGVLGESFTVDGVPYAIGDRIRFMQNDNHGKDVRPVTESWTDWLKTPEKVGVKNGSLGVITDYTENRLTVQLEDKRLVFLDPQTYTAFTHGYAMSIHKSEGSTFDKSYVLANRFMTPETTLVAMTRHRLDVGLYVSRTQFIDFKDLVETCSKGRAPDILRDYQISKEQQPYFDRVRQYTDLMVEAVTLREEMEGLLEPDEPLFKHPLYDSYQGIYQHKKQIAAEILDQWDAHKPYAHLAGLRHDVLEVDAGRRERLLSDLEQKASSDVQHYITMTQETRRLWAEISETHPGVLAGQHVLYTEYQEKKLKRNELAHHFYQSPKLHLPFFKRNDTKDYWGKPLTNDQIVYWGGVKHHAKAHADVLAEIAYGNSLTLTERQSYDLVKGYLENRNKAAALYSQIKQAKGSDAGMLDPSIWVDFKAAQIGREMGALAVVKSSKQCEPYFERLKMNEPKLLRHATQGEIRILCGKYTEEKDPMRRIEHAVQLQKALTDEGYMRILKGEKIDLQRLKFEIAYGIALAGDKASGTEDLDKLYTPIRAYQDSVQEASKLWKMAKTDKTIPHLNVQEAFNARNQNEATLKNNPAAAHLYVTLYPHNTRMKAWAEAALANADSVARANAFVTDKIPQITGADASQRTAAVTETAHKMNELITAYGNAQTYDDKSFAKYELRQELRMLREDFQLMTDLKILNPDMGEELQTHMELFFGRGRGR